MEYIKTALDTNDGSRGRDVSETVRQIIESVRAEGLQAIERFSRRFDGYSGPLFAGPEDIALSIDALSPRLRSAIENAAERVRAFHRDQMALFKDIETETSPGVRAGLRFVPVDSAAVYIPGGRYPLPTTAFMTVIPAVEAGVRRIAAFSPPSSETGMNKTVLATLGILGVTEILCVGGAQSVAAAALGFQGFDPVDMFAGPGNAFVTEAKRQLSGMVGIDGLAGPSEVMIIADDSADPRFLAADILAQAEHDPMSVCTLLCLDRETAAETLRETERLLQTSPTRDTAEKSWLRNGSIACCDEAEAIEKANASAPEHLELAVAEPRKWLNKCTSFGGAFLGHWSAEAFGDYGAGTNHVLPTGRSSRFGSGLWTGSFLRAQTCLDVSREAARALAPECMLLANAEGLPMHALAMDARLKETRL